MFPMQVGPSPSLNNAVDPIVNPQIAQQVTSGTFHDMPIYTVPMQIQNVVPGKDYPYNVIPQDK